MQLKYICTLSILVFLITSDLRAQDSDTITTVSQDTLVLETNDIIEIDTLENRPNTAALYSAALPGLGQAYNKKYWKIPIIYGGGLLMGYFVNYNNQLYKQYRDGLLAVIDGDDRTTPVPYNPRIDEEDYRRAVDYYRKYRDLSMLGVVLIYVLFIVDAHVDAHLELFTVEDDISLNLEPGFDRTAMQTNVIGLSLKLRFN
jgi:hypothetical protein